MNVDEIVWKVRWAANYSAPLAFGESTLAVMPDDVLLNYVYEIVEGTPFDSRVNAPPSRRVLTAVRRLREEVAVERERQYPEEVAQARADLERHGVELPLSGQRGGVEPRPETLSAGGVRGPVSSVGLPEVAEPPSRPDTSVPKRRGQTGKGVPEQQSGTADAGPAGPIYPKDETYDRRVLGLPSLEVEMTEKDWDSFTLKGRFFTEALEAWERETGPDKETVDQIREALRHGGRRGEGVKTVAQLRSAIEQYAGGEDGGFSDWLQSDGGKPKVAFEAPKGLGDAAADVGRLASEAAAGAVGAVAGGVDRAVDTERVGDYERRTVFGVPVTSDRVWPESDAEPERERRFADISDKGREVMERGPRTPEEAVLRQLQERLAGTNQSPRQEFTTKPSARIVRQEIREIARELGYSGVGGSMEWDELDEDQIVEDFLGDDRWSILQVEVDESLKDYVARGGRGLGEYQRARDRATGRYRFLLEPSGYDANGDPLPPVVDPNTGSPYDRSATPIGGGPIGIPTSGEQVARMSGAQTPDQVERAVNLRRDGAGTVTEFKKYLDGDEYQLNGWSSRRIAEHQRDLIEAGLLGERPFTYGHLDRETLSGHRNLLIQANTTGSYWNDVMPHLKEAHEQGVKTIIADTFKGYEEVNPFQAPSRNEIRVKIHDAVQQALGRKPTNAEMEALTGEMNQSYREQYEAERARYVQQQVASVEAPLEAIPENMRTDEDRAKIAEFKSEARTAMGAGAAGGAMPSQVNPDADFAVKFEDMFGQQIDARKQRGERDASGDLARGNMLSINNLLRGA